ncbi:MAG: hypothetical protein WCG93_11765 [Paludibacter sp.]
MNKLSLKHYFAILPIVASAIVLLVNPVEKESWFIASLKSSLNTNSHSLSAIYTSVEPLDYASNNTELPSYKAKQLKKMAEFQGTIQEVDFPILAKHENTNQAAKEDLKVEDKSAINVSYGHTQAHQPEAYSTDNHAISTQCLFYQISRIASQISVVALDAGIFRPTSQSASNNSSNSFLANNTLSISTDLSDANSPMLVGGDSNPGDPGIPVGDGTLLMLLMMLTYSLKKSIVLINRFNFNV